MDNELAGLGEEVRRAIEGAIPYTLPKGVTGSSHDGSNWLQMRDLHGVHVSARDWETVLAELLRLHGESIGNREDADFWKEKAGRYATELAAVKHELVQCDDIAIDDDLPRMVCDAQHERERLRSERDALRKRLKNSLVEVTYTSEIGYVVNGDEHLLDAACVADCVALVPLDDAEAKG